MNNFRPIQTGFLLPPSVDEWLPEKHLARFVGEMIDGLDLRVMRGSYRGSASYPPSLLLGILVYGYACSRAASWSGRAMTWSRSASSRRTSIPITTRSQRSGTGFSRRSVRPGAGGGFEQCYNAQAVVAAGSLLAANVVQAPNDKQQL